MSVTDLMMLSDWTVSCQPGRHMVITVSEQRWKYRWAAYKLFDETDIEEQLTGAYPV